MIGITSKTLSDTRVEETELARKVIVIREYKMIDVKEKKSVSCQYDFLPIFFFVNIKVKIYVQQFYSSGKKYFP